MITSPASGAILDRIRRLAGPNPEGSKLTDAERLHLVYLLGATMDDALGRATQVMASQLLCSSLGERGLPVPEFLALFDDHAEYNAVNVADLIAVHPNLRSTYLD